MPAAELQRNLWVLFYFSEQIRLMNNDIAFNRAVQKIQQRFRSQLKHTQKQRFQKQVEVYTKKMWEIGTVWKGWHLCIKFDPNTLLTLWEKSFPPGVTLWTQTLRAPGDISSFTDIGTARVRHIFKSRLSKLFASGLHMCMCLFNILADLVFTRNALKWMAKKNPHEFTDCTEVVVFQLLYILDLHKCTLFMKSNSVHNNKNWST